MRCILLGFWLPVDLARSRERGKVEGRACGQLQWVRDNGFFCAAGQHQEAGHHERKLKKAAT